MMPEGSLAQGLFCPPLFNGFGASALDPSPEPPVLRAIHATSVPKLKAQLRDTCPKLPGVYGMLNSMGELIYVGKAKRLRVRLFSYFHKRRGDPKARRIVSRAKTIVWEPCHSEFAALLRELELIRRWQPRYNVMGLPQRRRRTYVCIGRSPAPYVFVARRPRGDVMACHGPVPAGPMTRAAVRWLNDTCQLRDCPKAQRMVFADQR